MPRKKKVDEPKIEIPDTLTGNKELDKGLEELPGMTNVDALDVALQLQKIIRGNESILANQAQQAESLRQLRGRMDAYDRATQEFETDKEKYFQKIFDLAEKVEKTGDARDREVVKGVSMYQEAVQNARASRAADTVQFAAELGRMRRVTVTSPGRAEVIMQDGTPTPVLYPEEVRIKNKQWILQPGVPTEVPEIVAEVLKERRRIEAENEKMKGLLGKNLNNDVLVAKMKEIDKTYGIGE